MSDFEKDIGTEHFSSKDKNLLPNENVSDSVKKVLSVDRKFEQIPEEFVTVIKEALEKVGRNIFDEKELAVTLYNIDIPTQNLRAFLFMSLECFLKREPNITAAKASSYFNIISNEFTDLDLQGCFYSYSGTILFQENGIEFVQELFDVIRKNIKNSEVRDYFLAYNLLKIMKLESVNNAQDLDHYLQIAISEKNDLKELSSLALFPLLKHMPNLNDEELVQYLISIESASEIFSDIPYFYLRILPKILNKKPGLAPEELKLLLNEIQKIGGSLKNSEDFYDSFHYIFGLKEDLSTQEIVPYLKLFGEVGDKLENRRNFYWNISYFKVLEEGRSINEFKPYLECVTQVADKLKDSNNFYWSLVSIFSSDFLISFETSNSEEKLILSDLSAESLISYLEVIGEVGDSMKNPSDLYIKSLSSILRNKSFNSEKELQSYLEIAATIETQLEDIEISYDDIFSLLLNLKPESEPKELLSFMKVILEAARGADYPKIFVTAGVKEFLGFKPDLSAKELKPYLESLAKISQIVSKKEYFYRYALASVLELKPELEANELEKYLLVLINSAACLEKSEHFYMEISEILKHKNDLNSIELNKYLNDLHEELENLALDLKYKEKLDLFRITMGFKLSLSNKDIRIFLEKIIPHIDKSSLSNGVTLLLHFQNVFKLLDSAILQLAQKEKLFHSKSNFEALEELLEGEDLLLESYLLRYKKKKTIFKFAKTKKQLEMVSNAINDNSLLIDTNKEIRATNEEILSIIKKSFALRNKNKEEKKELLIPVFESLDLLNEKFLENKKIQKSIISYKRKLQSNTGIIDKNILPDFYDAFSDYYYKNIEKETVSAMQKYFDIESDKDVLVDEKLVKGIGIFEKFKNKSQWKNEEQLVIKDFLKNYAQKKDQEYYLLNLRHNRKYLDKNFSELEQKYWNDAKLQKINVEDSISVSEAENEQNLNHYLSEILVHFSSKPEELLELKKDVKIIEDTKNVFDRSAKMIEFCKKNTEKLQKVFGEIWTGDIKMQLNGLNKILNKNIYEKKLSNIVLETEKNPMNVLGMGDFFTDSCLHSDKINAWSVYPNALEVNKKILWIKDERGKILGRVLYGVNQDKELVRYRTYNNTSVSFEKNINEYLKKIAQNLNLKMGNSKSKNPEKLYFENWYADGIVNAEKYFTEKNKAKN